MPFPEATVCITTKNLVKDLRRALHSVQTQKGVELEVLVIDDGSIDGTADMVATQFPSVRLEKRHESRGLIIRRNEGANLATAPILFSIDDDAEFTGVYTVRDTLMEFDGPLIGAVAIPFIDLLQSTRVQQMAPNSTFVYITDAYVGTAHALRRDVFLKLGGYRAHWIHQGEESDYCIRMLEAGFVVRLGCASPITHYESSLRDRRRMDYYGRRNDVLFVWHNVPIRYLLVHLLGTISNGFKCAFMQAYHPWYMMSGMVAGALGIFRYYSKRHPVSLKTYKLNRLLRKNGPISILQVFSYICHLT